MSISILLLIVAFVLAVLAAVGVGGRFPLLAGAVILVIVERLLGVVG